MSLLQLRAAGIAPLFHDLSLTLSGTERLGLVAPNGTGKSTLLRVLAGQVELSTGEIRRARGLRPGLMPQEVPPALLELPLAEALRRALPPAQRAAEGWRAEALLDEMETPAPLRATPLRALSGGWQRLALAARLRLEEPGLLLLDEPTNHLDTTRIALLESWLAGWAVPMVVASHDRAFLDACTTHTLFLRPEEAKLHPHPYSRARALLAEEDAATARQRERGEAEAGRLRRSAASLKNIGVNSGSDAALTRAKQIGRRVARIEAALPARHRETLGEIRLAGADFAARRLVVAEDVAVRAPDGRLLFRTGRLEIAPGERLALLGENGAGKSSLLALLRRAMAEPGAVPGLWTSPALRPFHLDQRMAHLPAERTPQAFIATGFGQDDARSRALLAGIGLEIAAQRRPIGALSPGQRARLGLLALRLAEPNLHLLDEPTNHLDIPGREALEEAILAQRAACLLVSHDRHFVARLATRVLRIAGGRLREEAVP